MKCPFCNRQINGWTGLQEATKFQKHLSCCRKNPQNILSDGKTTVILQPPKTYDLMDAVNIRAKSGQ